MPPFTNIWYKIVRSFEKGGNGTQARHFRASRRNLGTRMILMLSLTSTKLKANEKLIFLSQGKKTFFGLHLKFSKKFSFLAPEFHPMESICFFCFASDPKFLSRSLNVVARRTPFNPCVAKS